jgi:DNA-directed RNA polymerase specialized sigma24 family protein
MTPSTSLVRSAIAKILSRKGAFLQSEEDMEDLVQDVMLRWLKVKEESRRIEFLNNICLYAYIDWLRRKTHYRKRDGEAPKFENMTDEVMERTFEVYHDFSEQEAWDEIWLVVDALGYSDRKIARVMLPEMAKGRMIKDIAAGMGYSGSRLSVVLMNMRKIRKGEVAA